MTTTEWIVVGLAFGFLVLTMSYGLWRYVRQTGSDSEKRQLRRAARAQGRGPKNGQPPA